MEYFIVTEDLIRDKARSYVPIKEKRDFINTVSGLCFDALNISATTGDSATPPLYKENPAKKQKYLAAAIAKLYMGEGFTQADEDDPWMMTDEDYDFFSTVRPLGQIERIRRGTKDRELQNKCFDLIQDFKDLREMLNSEIHGLMRAMNDTLARFQMLQAVQSTPEYLAEKKEEIERLKGEIESYMSELQKGENAKEG